MKNMELTKKKKRTLTLRIKKRASRIEEKNLRINLPNEPVEMVCRPELKEINIA